MNNVENYAGDYLVTVLDNGALAMIEVDSIVIDLEAAQAE